MFLDEFDAENFEEEIQNSEEDEDRSDEEKSSSKKQKKTFNPSALANAFQSVLRQNLPVESVEGNDSDDQEKDEDAAAAAPVQILAKSKAMDDLEEAQIDYRARKILKAQIRSTQESIHFSDANAPESLNFERSLRKLATRGVVQLFNAIQVGQQKKDEDRLLKRQEKLAAAQRSLPTASGIETADSISPSSSSASYFDFLKQQQQQASKAI